MSISMRTADDGYNATINVIPLVDIMLVLLIIFIITLPVMTHAVRIELPRVNPATVQPPPTEPINLAVEFDGVVRWNGNVVSGRDLEAYIRSASRQDPQPEVHVAVDRRAAYDDATRVLFALQRGGLRRIGFVTPTGASF